MGVITVGVCLDVITVVCVDVKLFARGVQSFVRGCEVL